jgi:integrase
MADYKLYLKDPKAEGDTQVRMHIHYNNKIAKVYVGEKINPDYWNKSAMRAKQSKKFTEYPEFNQRLSDAVEAAKKAMDAMRRENEGRYPDPRVLAKRVRVVMGLEVGKVDLTLFEYFDKRIREEEVRLKTENKDIHSGSYPRGIRRTRDLLREYESDNDTALTYDSIDLEFYYDFCEYMQDDKGYRVNTMGKHIKMLKHVMRIALAEGLHDNMAYTHPKFKILTEEVDTIYLDEEDLELLGSLDLNGYPGLDRARDLFLIGCWTGLRFIDLKRLEPDHIVGDDIVIKTQKTGKEVVIPILDPLRNILNRYTDSGFPKYTTNQVLNRSLKELGKKMLGHSKLKNLSDTTSKYMRITTHTARRSFATNFLHRGIPPDTIMGVTGHKTPAEFYKYIRTTPGEHAEVIRRAFNSSQSNTLTANH